MAIQEVISSSVDKQVSKLEFTAMPLHKLDVAMKGSIDDIPRIKAQKNPILGFQIKYEYDKDAIRKYLEELPRLRHLVFTGENGSFIGMSEVSKIKDLSFDKFVQSISAGDIEEIKKTVPGFIGISVKVSDNKKTALETMQSLDVGALPVVDENNIFMGIVDRSRLNASLLLDLSKKIES